MNFNEIIEEKGGITLKTDLNTGLNLNRILKTPTRILLRLKKQKCRDLPKLYQILKKIPWRDYLLQENVDFRISCSKSRLIHTGRIEESAKKALTDYFKANKIPKAIIKDVPNQLIFLRLENDELQISLDTSGDLLHKRDINTSQGHARIRENYASLLLTFLIDDYKEQFELIDPMCGTGTFLKEAHGYFKLNIRKFSFENWNVKAPTPQEPRSIWNINTFKGYDIDPELRPFHKIYEFENKDFFENKFETTSKGIIISNPPYGKRIKLPKPGKQYFKDLISHIKSFKQIHNAGIIIPEEFSPKSGFKKKLRFNQNGIKVDFLVF